MTDQPADRANPRRWSAVVPALVALSVLAMVVAMWADRVVLTPGHWLWNLDMPKIDFPLAVFANEALASGHLPLWNDRLGLGFPLYAEGQVGAFYPPGWLIFQLAPVTALDVYRVGHLAMAGIGAALLVLRLRGSRPGAVIALLVAILGGSVVAKLEWHNLVAAYAYLPWVLLPLVRRPRPTRAGLVGAGILYGVQALAGHPNTWLLTGVAVLAVLAAGRDGPLAGVRRALGVGLLGAAVGAVQLIPTALLTTISVRSSALSPNDLFASAATPFDLLGFAFQGAFAPIANGSWDVYRAWYPDGTFALLEAAAYVGLPVLGLAAGAATLRRPRPLLIAIAVLVAIPVLEALRPAFVLGVPLLNGLRSPVRAYLPATLLLGVVAGVAVGRLPRIGLRPGAVAIGVGIPVVAYGVTLAAAVLAPATFDAVVLASTSFGSAADVAARHDLAVAALEAPWPLIVELTTGLAIVLVASRAARSDWVRRAAAPLAVGIVAVPLLLFGPAPNHSADLGAFTSVGSDFIRAAASTTPHRMLTLHPPGWYAGFPDQPAAAGIPDLRMFSSLNLEAVDTVTELAASDGPGAATLRRALGVDIVVTFGGPCPGAQVATSDAEHAAFCRDPQALQPPYWLPLAAATAGSSDGSPIKPRLAMVNVDAATAAAVPLAVVRRDAFGLEATIDAPADGWVWIDRAWWPGWTTSIDGRSVETLDALGGQLIAVPAGRHVVTQALVPWDALAGLAIGLLASVGALLWVARDRPRRARTGAADRGPAPDAGTGHPKGVSPWARRRS